MALLREPVLTLVIGAAGVTVLIGTFAWWVRHRNDR